VPRKQTNFLSKPAQHPLADPPAAQFIYLQSSNDAEVPMPNEEAPQRFHPSPDESDESFHQALARNASFFQVSGPVAATLVRQFTVVQFDIDRTESAMARLSAKWHQADPEKWLALHAGFVTQRNALHLTSQRLLTTLNTLAGNDSDPSRFEEPLRKRDDDGNPIVEYRFWTVVKFSELPDDDINVATETIAYTDGSAKAGEPVPLRDFMGGEFMKPEYGLGEQFRRMLRAYKHPLHHPFDPSRIT
jgi:hypothetical protein